TGQCELDTTNCTTPATTYNSLTSAANWATFDVSTADAGAKGFDGAAFDGRYLYLVPYNNGSPDGIVARFDTQAPFGSTSSWSTFDVSTVDAGAKRFHGAAYDGRFLYLVPYHNGAADGIVARFDTQQAFGSASSWSTFDVTTVNAAAKGFYGAAFDGQYLYFVPYHDGTTYHGVAARFDTHALFGSASSWSAFDVATVNATAKGFYGAAFDGRYVYFVPYNNGTSIHGVVARFDTASAFDSMSSWATFDVSTVNAAARGFSGAAFDGQFVYFAPLFNGTAYHGTVARLDTQASFGAAASWSTFDVSTVNAAALGYDGAAFDGRFVYLVPHGSPAPHGRVARYDTQATFGAAASWSIFDVSTLNAGAMGFLGAGFDGQFVYLVPNDNGSPAGVVARFDAKSVPWLPKGWNASFF
ncbi:MAG: hypothetical protein IT373_25435, partial [Polyangiaceae bacterium]|nr:hypothetical protein [Polyangiaceae bacterium]